MNTFFYPSMKLIAARGWADRSMNRIQFQFEDIHSGKRVWTQAYGGVGGRPWSYKIPKNMEITKVFTGSR